MVSIPQHHACFKVQSCELRELGDETQKKRIEMSLRKYQAWPRKVKTARKTNDSVLTHCPDVSAANRNALTEREFKIERRLQEN
jgi:hypothetical protein